MHKGEGRTQKGNLVCKCFLLSLSLSLSLSLLCCWEKEEGEKELSSTLSFIVSLFGWSSVHVYPNVLFPFCYWKPPWDAGIRRH
jgi:hypothetical protein